MSQQSHQKTKYVARAYPADTTVIQAGLRRAFPLDETSPFEELLLAIDVADEKARGGRPGLRSK